MFDHYAKLEDYDIEKTIERETSGNYKKCLLTIVRVVRDRRKLYADLCHKAMKGLGTDDTRLIRIIVSRSEVASIHRLCTAHDVFTA